MKKILLITPIPPSRHSGNQATANRWESILQEIGHEVEIANSFEEQSPDLVIAIHLRKSSKSITAFKNKYPNRPLITLAAGTDLYKDLKQPEFTEIIKVSIRESDKILVLQPLAKKLIENDQQNKVSVIYQSTDINKFRASVHEGVSQRQFEEFQIVVIGHPRKIKDSLRAALAAKLLPKDSNIKVKLIGKTIEPEMRSTIEKEMNENLRFSWLGELDRAGTWREMGRSNLMVLSSLEEGGANVISEAVSIGLPILATKIDGNAGLLRENYSGFFEAKNTEELSALMLKCEKEPQFLKLLTEQVRTKASLFTKEQEKETLKKIITPFFT